jgi:hypothetical protein
MLEFDNPNYQHLTEKDALLDPKGEFPKINYEFDA